MIPTPTVILPVHSSGIDWLIALGLVLGATGIGMLVGWLMGRKNKDDS